MKALILFAHGARDPRWAEPFERLREILQRQMDGVAIELAYLELMAPDLPATVQKLVQSGRTELTVVPVFLGQGGHIRRDLPALIEQLNAAYPAVKLQCAVAVGEDAGVLEAVASYCLKQLANDA